MDILNKNGLAIDYNKLVTDEKPDLIESELNGWHKSRPVEGQELLELIDDKLMEEIEEVVSAKTQKERIKELAGFLILLEKMRESHKITEEDLTKMINSKVLAGQTYKKNIFLMSASAPADGHEVNSAKDKYTLKVTDKDGSLKTYVIKAVTDRYAIRQAKILLKNTPKESHVQLIKNLTI